MKKNTRSRRTAPPRKKACIQCSESKVRCDLVRPYCSRCRQRQSSCTYANAAHALGSEAENVTAAILPHSTKEVLSRSTFHTNQSNDFGAPSSIHLITPCDLTRIRDRWLDFYFTSGTKRVKSLNQPTVSLIRRTLRSYTSMWIQNSSHLPPFIHHMQWTRERPQSLSNCISLLRLCLNAEPGSEKLVTDSVQRELNRLISVVDSTDHFTFLAALQSYLLMSLFAYNNSARFPEMFVPGTISTLQDLASKVSATGLVCPEELEGGTPTWESWIIAEAKRRTIFCVYFFENLYNYDNGASSYIGEELALLPAPGAKWLWQADDRTTWEIELDAWLKSWDRRRGLVLAELWPQDIVDTDGFNDEKLDKGFEKNERIARWTEGADEFGMFLLAVCVATYNL